MKITKNLIHIAAEMELEAAMTQESLIAKFSEFQLKGFPAELDIAGRTEDHVQITRLDDLLGFAAVSEVSALTYDVTYFSHADEAEVTRQIVELAHDLDIDAGVIRELCAPQIAGYLDCDARRDDTVPVHSIVEAYVGGTAFAWYGMNDYPRLRHIILAELVAGGKASEQEFIARASRLQVESNE